MKIYSMTATFGKLDHKTLDLSEGLNVIHAPNEWGKSTWCAFLVAMFYGINTSSRSKKDFLAEKERYAPWSGKAMAGRMDISWQGRDITIERSAKGKIPMGNFRAYETDTGLEIPELTADNCGQTLLGVEQEVFTRAGFLRLADLPVTDAEALRRRLNALVTTGDESDAGDALEQKLKKLKNDCRHNKTGRIPQAESQRDVLQKKLDQILYLKEQDQLLQKQESAHAQYEQKLKNHLVALEYNRSLEARARAEKANGDFLAAKARVQQLEDQCRELPTAQMAQQEMERLHQLQLQWAGLQEQENKLPAQPEKPVAPTVFAGKDPRQALAQAREDRDAYQKLCKPASPLLMVLALVMLLAAAGVAFVKALLSLPCVAVAAVLFVLHLRGRKTRENAKQAICTPYGNTDPDSWVALAEAYAGNQAAYEERLAAHQTLMNQLQIQRQSLKQTQDMLTQGRSMTDSLAQWQQVVKLRQDQQEAIRQCDYAKTNAENAAAWAQTAPEPEQPDELTLSQEESQRALERAHSERISLQQQLAKCEANMEALGDQEALEQELAKVQSRIEDLERHNAALTMALETLAQATTELQRRFAPRISARAKELFNKLTGGRYDRLQLSSNLSMEVAAIDEDISHGVQWRSDGTADQLYLALRLAVAEELTPDAPLVLDDAFVRFDDTRLEAAMEILKEYADKKQIILFSCQTREQMLADKR